MRETLLREGPRIRRWILVALVALVPLLFLRTLNDPINVPKLGLLIVGVSIVLSIRVAEGLQTRDFEGLKSMWVPAAALAAALLVGWIFSPYKGWALWGVYPRLLGLLPYLFVIAFGILLADAFRGDASPVAWALASAGGIAGAYAAIQFLGLDPFSWSVKGDEAASDLVVSTLGNPNFAGAFFAIALPISLGVIFLHPERRPIASVVAAFIVIGWVVAGSQAGWAAGVAGLAVFGGYALATRWRLAKVAGILVATAMAASVVGVIVLSIADVGVSKIPATVQRRGDWWEAAVDMAAGSPLVGRGPNVFALEHSQHRTEEDVRQSGLDITDDPHSVFLSFLTSAGLFGGIGYLIAAVWVVKRASGAQPGLMAAAILGSLTAYFIQSLASVDTVALRTVGWTTLAGFVISTTPVGVVTPRSRSGRRKERHLPLRSLPGVALVTVMGLAGIWVGAQLIFSDARFRHAADLLNEGQGEPALRAYEESISFNGNIFYRRAYGNLLGDLAVGLGAEGEPFIEKARAAFDFVHVLPQVNATLDYARTLKDWAAVEPSAAQEAVEIYALAVRYDPIDTVLLGEASGAALELEAHDEVIAILEPVVERLDQGSLWGNLALAQARLGDREAALQSAQRALALAPTNAAAIEAQGISQESEPSE